MNESSDTTTQTRLEIGRAIDLELARIAQGPPGEEADRARRELLERHEGIATEAAERAITCDPHEASRAARRALEQAIRGFDPERGVDFASYAAARVRGALRQLHERCAQAPTRGMRQGRFLQVRVAMTALHAELDRPPSVAEVAEHIGYQPDDVLDALAVRSAERVRTTQLAACLGDDDSLAPDLTEAISELDERTRIVLYGLTCDQRSRREIAAELGVSTFDVHDLEQRGRRQLRRVTSTG